MRNAGFTHGLSGSRAAAPKHAGRFSTTFSSARSALRICACTCVVPLTSTPATSAIAATLQANVIRGWEASQALRRTGSSMSTFVIQPSRIVSTMTATRVSSRPGSTRTKGAKTSSGQCQRYTE